MGAPRLPEDCAAAEVGRGGARSPLKTGQLKSLRAAFELVEDPRRAQSRRHPLTTMLTLIALGLLMSGRDMLNIWSKVACLDQRQREAIGHREMLGVGTSIVGCHGRCRVLQAPKPVEFVENSRFGRHEQATAVISPTHGGVNCSRFPTLFVHSGRNHNF